MQYNPGGVVEDPDGVVEDQCECSGSFAWESATMLNNLPVLFKEKAGDSSSRTQPQHTDYSTSYSTMFTACFPSQG